MLYVANPETKTVEGKLSYERWELLTTRTRRERLRDERWVADGKKKADK